VTVEIGRQNFPGQAKLFEESSDALIEGARRFLTQLPRDARVYGIKLDAKRKPIESDLLRAAEHLILVEVELDLASGA